MQTHWEKGKQFQAAHLPGEAQTEFMAALQADPEFAPVYRSLAELSMEQKDIPNALRGWKEYLRRDPKAEHARCRLAQLELSVGLEVPALKDAEEELRAAPDCARAHLIAGLLTARKGNGGEATRHLKIAAAAYPDQANVQMAYARVLAQTEQDTEAVPILNAIVTKDKTHAEPYYWLGVIAARRSDPKAAEEHLQRAVAIAPDYAEAHHQLAKLFQSTGRHVPGIDAARKAVRAKKHFPAAWFTLAQLASATGRGPEAQAAQAMFRKESDLATRLKSLLKSYAADPKNAALEAQIGFLQLDLDEPATAAYFLQSAQSHQPDPKTEAALKKAQALLAARQPLAPPDDLAGR